MMPIVAPSRSPTESWLRSAHRPCRTKSVNGPNRLTKCSVSANTPSATALVPLPGVITTGMPRAVAAGRSTWSTPTPVRARTRSRGARSRNAASTTASARTIAPAALAMSCSPGSVTNAIPSPSTPVTSAGSMGPSATTTGRLIVTTSVTWCDGCRGVAAECCGRNRWDLLPRATLGGGGSSRDDLSHMMGIVDRGVTRLATGHCEEELLRLNDLQIVVAHAGARTRLKACIVAEVGVAEHGGVAEVRAASTQANAQFVHLLEVPGRRSFGAIDLEANAALGSDDDSGGLQRAHRSRRPGVGCKTHQRRGVIVVFHRPQLAVLDDREVGPRAHGQNRPLGVDSARQGSHLADRPEQVLQEVDGVAQQVTEGTETGEVADEPPRQCPFRFGGVPVEKDGADIRNPAEFALGHEFAYMLHGRGMAIVIANRCDDAGRASGRCHVGRLLRVTSDRLLDPERLAGLGGCDADFSMETRGRADRDHVNVRVSENLPIVSACPGIAQHTPCVFGPIRCSIYRMHEARPQTQLGVNRWKRLVRPRVQFAHPADADQADANVRDGGTVRTGHD